MVLSKRKRTSQVVPTKNVILDAVTELLHHPEDQIRLQGKFNAEFTLLDVCMFRKDRDSNVDLFTRWKKLDDYSILFTWLKFNQINVLAQYHRWLKRYNFSCLMSTINDAIVGSGIDITRRLVHAPTEYQKITTIYQHIRHPRIKDHYILPIVVLNK